MFWGETKAVIYQKLQEVSQQSRYAYALIVGYLDRLLPRSEPTQGGRLIFDL